ncbi:MAG: non-canonical purine NTP pyrophosphatase [Pirellulaceae bacterium]|nr:non-canonical purine NTP pyrophosphatase [Pirellulaceae bacterium]MDP7019222.1 non-canonical purine NTP pyrophosphatase [Pirellulaceae bacterium]
MSKLLVLGTNNRKKGIELRELLTPCGFQLQTLADIGGAIDVDETGSSFRENAELKASQQARHLICWVLGEDSGICVDALGGRPGIYSARYSGDQATDESNNRLLLEELNDTPKSRRTAHYVCHAALADPRGVVRANAEASCRGRIRRAPVGDAGFGYDPLFEVVEYHRTFGQLGDTVKSMLSHRSRTIRLMAPQIIRLAETGAWDEQM